MTLKTIFAVIVFSAVFAVPPAMAAGQDASASGPSGRNLVDAINDSNTVEGFTGNLRAQVLLDRAYFSPGEIDGVTGSNMTRAVRGYQRSKGLDATGQLNAATWEHLNSDNGTIVTEYAITPEDIEGPYYAIPAGMMPKSKLKRLGYKNILEMYGERFHASPALLKRLNPSANFSRVGEVINVPIPTLTTLAPAAKLVVDKSERVLMLLNGAGDVYAQFPVTFGSDKYDPLPLGDWGINGVFRNPTYNYNSKLFWEDRNGPKRTAVLPPGPNSPVGMVWIDLTKEHYGIHGTPEPGNIAKGESHGCVRLTNWSVLAVANAVSKETPVLFRE